MEQCTMKSIYRYMMFIMCSCILIVCFAGCSYDEKTALGDINTLKRALNNYYIGFYRESVIITNSDLLAGKDIFYEVYQLDNNYIGVNFLEENPDRKEILFANAKFCVGDNSVLIPCLEDSIDIESEIAKNTNSKKLFSDSFYIPLLEEIQFEDYEGKQEHLEMLENMIREHYFAEHTHAWEYPIFYESTSAEKVFLMDFDELTSCYSLLVFTQDGYVYDVKLSPQLLQNGGQWEIPLARVSVDDIESYSEDVIYTGYMSTNFMEYYEFFMEHVIRCIKR